MQRGALTIGIILIAFAVGYVIPGLYESPGSSPTPVATVAAPAPTQTTRPGAAASPTLPAPGGTPRATGTLSPGPAAPTATATPSVARAPSPSAETSPLAAATPTSAPATAPTATPAPRVYVVKSGDTLSGIADKFGVSVDSIVAANQLSSPDRLSEGEKLIIPVR